MASGLNEPTKVSATKLLITFQIAPAVPCPSLCRLIKSINR